MPRFAVVLRFRPPAWGLPISASNAFRPAWILLRSGAGGRSARAIDRRLISIVARRYFVATGKRGRQGALAGKHLKDAIRGLDEGDTNPTRLSKS